MRARISYIAILQHLVGELVCHTMSGLRHAHLLGTPKDRKNGVLRGDSGDVSKLCC